MLARKPLPILIRVCFSRYIYISLPTLPFNFSSFYYISYYYIVFQLFLKSSFFTCHLNAIDKIIY